MDGDNPQCSQDWGAETVGPRRLATMARRRRMSMVAPPAGDVVTSTAKGEQLGG